jgi:hypothetical protein
MSESPFREVWAEAPDGQSMCALINGERGWLMYLRENGDAGFSSRNPTYAGAADATIEYRLDNGQLDEYPASWAYPVKVIESALRFFTENHAPPPFIHWHNDAGDGVILEHNDA